MRPSYSRTNTAKTSSSRHWNKHTGSNHFRSPEPELQASFSKARSHFHSPEHFSGPNRFDCSRSYNPGNTVPKHARSFTSPYSSQYYYDAWSSSAPISKQQRDPTHQQFVRPSVYRGPRPNYTHVDRKTDASLHSKPHHKKVFQAKVMFIIRGAPGSGKSTLARHLKDRNGMILSTDNYFMSPQGYLFDPSLLSAAHEWNQSETENYLREGRSPVIIDNTNMEGWEMEPYMQLALIHGYKIEIVEPNTPWKFNAIELAKRNLHGVTKNSIEKMLARYEDGVTVQSVLGRQRYREYQSRCLSSSSTNQDARSDADLTSMMQSLNISKKDHPSSCARPQSSRSSSSSQKRNFYAK